jgi:hypothetical protein
MPGRSSRIRSISTRAIYAAGAILLFGVGAAFSNQYTLRVDLERRAGSLGGHSGYRPSHQLEVGEQLVLVYVGSSTCFWSNQPELADAVKEAKARVAEDAEARGWSFQAHGVALDWSTERGIEHLSGLGSFDEVSAGSNWGNSFALNHLWPDPSELPSTPMVVVYRRTFVAPRSEEDEMTYAERGRVLLEAKRGLPEITEWAHAGAPLSELGPAGS